jgi:hypothetical protein
LRSIAAARASSSSTEVRPFSRPAALFESTKLLISGVFKKSIESVNNTGFVFNFLVGPDAAHFGEQVDDANGCFKGKDRAVSLGAFIQDKWQVLREIREAIAW